MLFYKITLMDSKQTRALESAEMKFMQHITTSVNVYKSSYLAKRNETLGILLLSMAGGSVNRRCTGYGKSDEFHFDKIKSNEVAATQHNFTVERLRPLFTAVSYTHLMMSGK